MERYVDITAFGAKEGTGQVCTAEIQSAIDEANRLGGATVLVPPGTFVTGTLLLGGASLHLMRGAVLKGSPNLADYRPCGYRHNEMGDVLPLICSMESSGVRLSGQGTIDLNGDPFFDFSLETLAGRHRGLTEEELLECPAEHGARPNQPIFFYRCTNVAVEGLTLINAPCWTLTFVECSQVRLTDLNIDNSLRIPNNDGVHFCGCRDVLVRGCVITSGDDCIALSGITDWDVPCENVVISDCILTSRSKAIVIGYMHSIVRDVCVSNVVIRGSNRGICIMASAGTGLVEHVAVSNVRLDTRVPAGHWWGNGEPILLMATWHHFDNYDLPAPNRSFPVSISDVHIHQAVCTGENAIGIVGQRGNIDGVRLTGLSVRLKDSERLHLKGRVLDISPSAGEARLPEEPCWLLVQEARHVAVEAVVAKTDHGSSPVAVVRDCQDCEIHVNGEIG